MGPPRFRPRLGSLSGASRSDVRHRAGRRRAVPGRNIDEIYRDYFYRVREIAATGTIDCLSHLDLIKIHGHRPKAKIERWSERRSILSRSGIFALNSRPPAGANRSTSSIPPTKSFSSRSRKAFVYDRVRCALGRAAGRELRPARQENGTTGDSRGLCFRKTSGAGVRCSSACHPEPQRRRGTSHAEIYVTHQGLGR